MYNFTTVYSMMRNRICGWLRLHSYELFLMLDIFVEFILICTLLISPEEISPHNIYLLNMHAVRSHAVFGPHDPTAKLPAKWIESAVGDIHRAHCGSTFSGCNIGSKKAYGLHLSKCQICAIEQAKIAKTKKDAVDKIAADEARAAAKKTRTAAKKARAIAEKALIEAEKAEAKQDGWLWAAKAKPKRGEEKEE